MGAKVGGKGGFNEINMTPLIDIVLVVLIIMMVSIPVQLDSLGLKLPSPIPPPPDTPPPKDQLVIALYGDGTLALNRRLMTEDTLQVELARRLRPMDPKNVFVDADPKLEWGNIVHAIDLARGAGAEKVGFTKMKETGPLPPTEVASGAMPRGLTLGSPLTIGALDQAQADAALQPFKGNLEQCYLQGLAAHPDLNGRVMPQISVGPEGQIMEHSISSSTLEPGSGVEECIDAVLPSFKFPALGPDKTALVRYPLLYSPG